MSVHRAAGRRQADSALDRRLGRRIRILRHRRGIGEEAFAAALGIPVPALRSVETGAWRLSAARLLQIAAELRVPLLDLFAGVPRTARLRTAGGGDCPDERELLDFVRACLRLRDASSRARLSQALAIAADND